MKVRLTGLGTLSAWVAKPGIMAFGQVLLGLESIPGAMERYTKAWDRIRATR